MTRHQFFAACPPFVNTVYCLLKRLLFFKVAFCLTELNSTKSFLKVVTIRLQDPAVSSPDRVVRTDKQNYLSDIKAII